MKKFIVLSLVLGVLGSSSFILKDLTTADNLSSKDIQHEQVAKAPAKYSTNILDSQKIITWSGAQHLRCYIIATASS